MNLKNLQVVHWMHLELFCKHPQPNNVLVICGNGHFKCPLVHNKFNIMLKQGI